MMYKRWFRGGDDRGSMPMAMLVITVGLCASALLSPIVVRQFTSTRSLVDRNTALNAAQAGLDGMMAQVRAASQDDTTNGVVGLLEDLPACSLSGDAGAGTGQSLPWTVTVTYYDQDNNALSCPPTTVPTTAKVVATGSGAAGTQPRTLTATYVFTTSNSNIPGGSIHIDTSSAGNLCFDAGSTKPAAGTKVLMKTCNGSSQQQFGYTEDLYLKLVNSESGSASYGMCLYPGTSLTATSHSSGNVLNFQACPANRTAGFQYALDGGSQFHSTSGTDPNQSTENLCVNVQTTGLVGSQVVLGSCSGSLTTTIFRSDPGVGAGMAGDATNQLVNYAQFSRCLDVTGKDPNASYMIAWFCKQSPNGGVDSNQQWVHPTPIDPAVSATGNIIVTLNGTKYCLKSPLSVSATAYATVTACSTGSTTYANASKATGLIWTVYHDTGAYSTSFQIKDTAGYCLTPTDLNASPKDTHTDGTSKVKVAVCSSNELQKWNAPPNINKATPLTNLIEN